MVCKVLQKSFWNGPMVITKIGISYSKNSVAKQHISNSLQWRHNGRDSVSNHQPHDCFLNRLFRHRSKKTSKLRVTGLCTENSPEAGEFPAQMASNAENVPSDDVIMLQPTLSVGCNYLSLSLISASGTTHPHRSKVTTLCFTLQCIYKKSFESTLVLQKTTRSFCFSNID